MSKIVNGCAGTGCNSIEEFDDYNNRLERVRSRLEDYGNSAAISCEVYNYYGNVANPTTCVIPSQGTGDDGNVLGQFYQDSVNTMLSHTASLAYDPTHRLTSAVATGNSTYNLTFAYDQFGNMTCQQNQQTNGLCPQYSFSSSTNRITNSGYTYDASGDLTNDGAHSYQYDAEGRLVSVDNGTTASYVYNALGERVEEDAGGTYSEYVFGKDGNSQPDSDRAELSFPRRRESSLWAPRLRGGDDRRRPAHCALRKRAGGAVAAGFAVSVLMGRWPTKVHENGSELR